MKKLSSIMVAFAASVMMLTSCLDGGNSNSSTSITRFGVVEFDSKTLRPLLYFSNSDYPIYAQELISVTDNNSCVLFYALIEINDEVNNDVVTTGYYLPTQFDYVGVSSSSISSYLKDTTEVIENELAVKQLYDGGYVKEHLFLQIDLSENKPEQKNVYTLEYGDMEPEEVNGKRIYNLYLRAVKVQEGKTGTEARDNYGFKVNYFLDRALQQEKEANQNAINLRINYISELDETNEEDIKIKKWSYLDISPIQFATED
ncbi:MAG: hypothetical protein LUG51_13025 [Tannerellaceae bacterium]|nr:hypothetical protein [Tannerellaceae bacterium]